MWESLVDHNDGEREQLSVNLFSALETNGMANESLLRFSCLANRLRSRLYALTNEVGRFGQSMDEREDVGSRNLNISRQPLERHTDSILGLREGEIDSLPFSMCF